MVYIVEKSFVDKHVARAFADKLVAQNPLHFNQLTNQFLFEVSYNLYIMFSSITRARICTKSSFLRSFVKLGNQYIVRNINKPESL